MGKKLQKNRFPGGLVICNTVLSDGSIYVKFYVFAGALEANFVEPTHNKQDFEKTDLLQKLENRLKEMTLEYW